MHFFDSIDDAADHFFRVGSAEGRVGAVDGGLDYRIGVFDCVDEGGMGRSVALGDTETGVAAQLGGKFGGVPQESCDVVLLAETCSEGGRADSACSADDEDLHGYGCEGD